MFFSLLFLCICLGGNADVNNDAGRELSKLLSSEEAYDGSLVIPITKNSVGEFPDDVEYEVAVGAEAPKSELLKNVKIHSSSNMKNKGAIENILFTDANRVARFNGDGDNGKTIPFPYWAIFDMGEPVFVDKIALKPYSKEECPKRMVLEHANKTKAYDKWKASKVMTLMNARNDRVTWDTDKQGPGRYWRLNITSSHGTDSDKDTSLQFVQFYGRYPKGHDMKSNFEKAMFGQLKELWQQKNQCQSNGLYCKCGFAEITWQYKRVERDSRDCYTLDGLCQKCSEPNPIKSIGFDYKYEEDGSKDIYTLRTQHYYSDWDEPAYPFTCKDNKVIIGVKSKYYRYEKLGDRDFYTLKIKCDRMKATIPSNRIPESYNRRRLFFSDLEKKFEVHLKARELGKLKDGSSSDDKSSEKSSDSSDSKSDKKAAKEAKKSSSKEKEAVKKVAKEAKKENKKAKKKLKQVKKMAKKEAKKALKKIKKELKNAKKATRKEKKQIAKKVTKKILKKINRKMEDAGGKRLRFSDLEGRRRNRRGGCNRCKCKRSCSCDGDGDRCSCRRKCNCKKQRRRPSGNQFQQMHLHFGQPNQQTGPGCPNASKCPNAPAGSPCSGPCGGSKASPCAKGYGNPNDCRKKIGNYVRTLIGEESDIFRLLKVKIQNMHMLNHIMREGMDRHLRKKIISMHDLHDLISKKMDPGKKKAATLKKILDAVENIKTQRKDYNDKLSKHFAKIKDRLQKEHKRLRKRLKRHGEGTKSGLDGGVNKILDALKKQNEGKRDARASRLEEKMDKVLEAINNRQAQQDDDSEDAAEQRAKKLQDAQAAALKEHSEKQKEYWNKLKGFLENFKAKQYGKLSKSAEISQDSDASKDSDSSDSDSADAAYKTQSNLPWFLQQALKHHHHLATIVHVPGDSSEEDLSSEDSISLDDLAVRRRLQVDDLALDSFMDAYGPETEVGESLWNLDDEDESDSDSFDYEYAVGAPEWEMFDVDDSGESDEEPVGESAEWEEYPLSEADPEESEFEDSLHYFKHKADAKFSDEYMVGSFDPDDMVDQFLLKALEPQDHDSEFDDSEELQVGDWYSSDSSEELDFSDLFNFDDDDEEAVGAEMPDYLFDDEDEDSVSDSYEFDSDEDDEDEIALGDSDEYDSDEIALGDSDEYDSTEIALGDSEITMREALELLALFSDDSEEALGAEMPDYLFKYMDEDYEDNSEEDSSEEESSESGEESVGADMPDYLFKYMDEDDEEAVSAEMPAYLFKYMDEDSSEESESDSSENEYSEDENDEDDSNDETALAEYNDLYDLSESEEQVGEPSESEDSSSESEEYFLMQHTVDDEEAVGSDEIFENFYSEQAVGDSEKPLSVGDSFFDINDDQLVKDLASKFGLEDDEENTASEEDSVNSDEIDLTDADAESNQRKTHDNEIMVGVSASHFGVKRVAFWSNSSFVLAVTICSIVLLGVFAYLIIQWYQDKGDGVEYTAVDDYFEELEG